MPLMVRGEAVPLLFSCLLYNQSCRRKLLDGLVTSLALTPILATKLLNSFKATLAPCLTQPGNIILNSSQPLQPL